eukprot:gene11602-12796_t
MKFSPEGSNESIVEEATAYWFEEMLENLDKEAAEFKAEDLLAFITGSPLPPTSGFEKLIEIEFYSQHGR